MFTAGNWSYADQLEALEKLQSLMIARAERQLSDEDQREYESIRRAVLADAQLRKRLPKLVLGNSDLGGIWSTLRDHSGQWEPRRMFVREQMRAALDYSMEQAAQERVVQSSNWTGIQSKRERLLAARRLLPLAQATVEGLIAELERPTGNGGPPLEDRVSAIENLKLLHSILGSCIKELESVGLDQRTLDEAAGYFARAAKSLRNDPMPYLVSGSLAGIFAILGAGEIGGYLAGIALMIQKNAALER